MHHEAKRDTSTYADDLRAVDALVDNADGGQIWQVLDYAAHMSVSVAEAYQVIIGDLPDDDRLRPTDR